MKRMPIPIEGLDHYPRRDGLVRCRVSTAGLAIACAFIAGFAAAIWTIGLIVTRR